MLIDSLIINVRKSVFKGCDSNFEVYIFPILKFASNETATLL